MTFDPTSAALGAIVALAVVSLVAAPALKRVTATMARMRKSLHGAWEEAFALQREINELYEITPKRQANGRFAKRQ